jgi:IS30 family transposase
MDALVAPLPASLRRSLTWDQGKELALHPEVAHVLSMPVFLCDPHSPWQRPSNENRLLRQYFRKGSDPELNARPCKTLGRNTPTGRLAANKHGDQPGSPSSGPASTTGQALRG